MQLISFPMSHVFIAKDNLKENVMINLSFNPLV